MNLLIVGYYYKKNLGDDLFLQLAKKNIFNLHECRYLNVENIDKYDIDWCNKIVLFGGETLNNYFLDKLLKIKENTTKKIDFYAIGVSSDSNYNDIYYKVDIFNYIIFRNIKDYNIYKTRYNNKCLYLPDIVFLLNKHKHYYIPYRTITSKKKIVGYFLSQTAKNIDFSMISKTIQFWTENNYDVYLFSMCNNDNTNENDNILNLAIYNDNKHVKVFKSPLNVLELISTLSFIICFRFHAHILSISYGIPFISVSNTPKVNNLLIDNNLTNLSYYNKDWLLGCKYILENKDSIKQNLLNIYINNYNLAKNYYNLDYLNIEKTNTPFYFNNIDNYIQSILKTYTKTNNNLIDTKILLYKLLGINKSEYEYGLSQKINTIDNLFDDLKWVLNQELLAGNKILYNKLNTHIKITPSNFINFYSFDQNEMRGLHRSGWQFVIDNLESKFGSFSENAIICDLYIDRTFHWEYEINSTLGIIPYTKPWIGFIHHTFNIEYSPYNIINLFNKPNFIKSLEYCKAIFVLSKYLADSLKLITNISIYNLYHPTELNLDIRFSIDKFNNNPYKRIIQVGAWLRDIQAIYNLKLHTNPYNLHKTALIGKKMEGYYIKGNTICNLLDNNDVELISNLENNDYDKLLGENIVFIKLIDVSAANTIIECIARNTPLLVNRHPAIIEYLGIDYPFFYDDLDNASKLLNDLDIINKTHIYLSKMDKSIINIENFLNSFYKIVSKL